MKNAIRIGKKTIGDNRPVFIIAEAGVNHNGRLETAKRLVDLAKEAGADAVKFQTYQTDQLVLRNAPVADYQKRSHYRSQYDMLKKLELSFDAFESLFAYCRKKEILFLSTPFDLGSAAFLQKLGVAAFKIGSGDLNNSPLVAQCARTGKPMILSTGMSTMDEIRDSLAVTTHARNKNIILLHCTSNYPTISDNVHLKAMDTLRDRFHTLVGYSDHTLGTDVAVAAVARGACIIEKHFTLDKTMKGPDHQASLNPAELMSLVKSIRSVEKSLGHEQKKLLPSEIKIRTIARRSVVTEGPIAKGERFTAENVSIKRPATGLAPKHYFDFIGHLASRDLKSGVLLQKRDIGS